MRSTKQFVKTSGTKFGLLLCCIMFGLIFSVRAQDNSIAHGIVKDGNGNALPGASVTEKGDPANSTLSDYSGHFTLHLKGKSNQIIVTFVGYQAQTVRVSSANLAVSMNQSNNS